jgi:hypothetical protein
VKHPDIFFKRKEINRIRDRGIIRDWDIITSEEMLRFTYKYSMHDYKKCGQTTEIYDLAEFIYDFKEVKVTERHTIPEYFLIVLRDRNHPTKKKVILEGEYVKDVTEISREEFETLLASIRILN